MDSETLYSIAGIAIFSLIVYKTLKNDNTAKIQTKEEKSHEIVNNYRKEIREELTLLKDDSQAQLVKRKELLNKFNLELSSNIFFDAYEVREILEELSSMSV